MLSIVPKGLNVDTVEFAHDFDAAFEAKVVSFNISVDARQPMYTLGHYQPISYNGPSLYTVSISCYVSNLPITKTLMDHFSVLDPETHLMEVKTTSRVDPTMGGVSHMVDLTYRTLNYDKFVFAIKNIAYNRFSEQFHKQLEDKLDQV
jgi:hypothetical protein